MPQSRLIRLCVICIVLVMSWQALAQETPTPTETPSSEVAPLPTQEPLIMLVTEEPLPVIPTAEAVLPTEEPTLVIPTAEAVLPTEEPTLLIPTSEVSITPTPIILTPTLSSDPLTTVFSTSFDAPALEFPFADAWTPITVENGMAVQSGTGRTDSAYNTLYLDAAIRVRVLFGNGALILTLRDNSSDALINGYSASLASDGTLSLLRHDATVASTRLTLTTGDWTTLELRAIGAQVTVLVNSTESLT